MSESEKKLDLPDLSLLEAELEREQYKNSFGQVLKSTVFSLLVVAAVSVLIAVLLLPVAQKNCRQSLQFFLLFMLLFSWQLHLLRYNPQGLLTGSR